jgi:Uma2 family endonuclease
MVHLAAGHRASRDAHAECLHFDRAALRFPVELAIPRGFLPQDPATWPDVEGRLEYVDGGIRYMPPCGAVQQGVCADLTTVLGEWLRPHRDFFLGANEAGMIRGADVRAADAAIWRRADRGAIAPRSQRVAPLLAVEVAGEEEREPALRDKARWYLDAGRWCGWSCRTRARWS